MIGAYMVTCNRPKLFGNSLRSFVDTMDREYRLIVLDNASDHDTALHIQELCNQFGAEYLRVEEHLGFGASWNYCIRYLDQYPNIEYYLHIHDDVAFKQNWLANILNVMEKDNSVWCARPEIASGNAEGLADFANSSPPDKNPNPKYSFVDNISTAVAVFARRCFEIIGLFDERFDCAGEDTDYYYRLLLAHRPQAEIQGARVYHLRTGGIEGDPELMEQRRIKYAGADKLIRDKWAGVELDYKTEWTLANVENPILFDRGHLLPDNPANCVFDDTELGKIYNKDFYNHQIANIPNSAKIIVDIIIKICKPTSVIDLGCYIGIWLKEFLDHGVIDIMGVDGHHVKKEMTLIDDSKIIRHDLTMPFVIDRKFDVALMLEVAEHIDSKYEDILFESLFSLSDIIVFSSNNCDSGTHHVNVHTEEYWDKKFEQAGYVKCDLIRPLLKSYSEQEVRFYYKNATIIYAKPSKVMI